MKRLFFWCAGTLVTVGILVFVLGEFFLLSATSQHPRWVYRGLAVARDTIVQVAASDVEVPAAFEPLSEPRGAALFQKNCVQCHGAPGVAPEQFALGMMPVPPSLVGTARHRSPGEIYWFIRYGLKMTGMPAWELRMSDEDMWRVTRFVADLPRLAPADYADLLEKDAGEREPSTPSPTTASHAAPPDAKRGRLALQVFGCHACHIVPGLVGPSDMRVGPSLAGVAERRYIAGVLPNSPENLARWIADPQDIDPLSAMPDLGVPPNLARDIAAYLYSLSGDAPGRGGSKRASEPEAPGGGIQ